MPQRNARQCRHRYTNYLNENYKPSPWTENEDAIIISMYNEVGAKWVMIAKSLEGRTGNDVKNRWHKHILKSFPLLGHSKPNSRTNAPNLPTSLAIHSSTNPPIYTPCKPAVVLNQGNSPPAVKEDVPCFQFNQISLANGAQPPLTVHQPILISPISQPLATGSQVFSNYQNGAPQIVKLMIAPAQPISINSYAPPPPPPKPVFNLPQYSEPKITDDEQQTSYSEVPDNSQLYHSANLDQMNLITLPKIQNPPICVGPKNNSSYLQSVLN